MAEYDYGDGRTYATPQAAFDALQAANEAVGVPQAFTATNYVRGYGTAQFQAFAATEPVLRLVNSSTGRGVLPSARYPLVLDLDEDAAITFRDTEIVGALVNGDSSGQNLASHVRVSGLKILSVDGAAGLGIVLCEDRTGAETCCDWSLEDCEIAGMTANIVAGCLLGLRLTNVILTGPATSGAVFADGSAGAYGPFTGVLAAGNLIAHAAGPAISLLSDGALIQLLCASLQSTGAEAVVLNDDGAATWAALTLVNSILQGATGEEAISSDYADLAVMGSDGNCYHGPGGLADVGGVAIADLSAWRTWFGQDAHSQEADPLFVDERLTLASDSPCLLVGSAATAAGLEGNSRSYAIDQGARQSVNASGWDVNVANSRIRVALNASLGVSGL
jgi:hypothetical protein